MKRSNQLFGLILSMQMFVFVSASFAAGETQRLDVGRVQIALAQMHEVTTLFERQLPVIVDDELRAGRVRRQARADAAWPSP